VAALILLYSPELSRTRARAWETMTYRYDVFVSYPRERDHQLWVREIFIEAFKLHLTQDLGRPPKIFYDQIILDGSAWPEKLKAALATSRLLVPVWSINYFFSDWCMGECAVFLHREQRLGYRTTANPCGLIQPIRLFDGKKYPSFAQQIQSLDVTEFNLISENYKKTEQYFGLLKLVKGWTPSVADAITGCPDWSEEWMTPTWLEEPLRQYVNAPSFRVPEVLFAPPSLADVAA
jgi:hypothetical protein